ncbi:hypothetical protein [Virgibacillus sp. DJP39]|uniref:hypothetical protein n=1 Tax=Virgibacillus sp. DJP39 TaxID=3409790 RepID=UPI003BB506AF
MNVEFELYDFVTITEHSKEEYWEKGQITGFNKNSVKVFIIKNGETKNIHHQHLIYSK